jgi:hypothetical protein
MLHRYGVVPEVGPMLRSIYTAIQAALKSFALYESLAHPPLVLAAVSASATAEPPRPVRRGSSRYARHSERGIHDVVEVLDAHAVALARNGHRESNPRSDEEPACASDDRGKHHPHPAHKAEHRAIALHEPLAHAPLVFGDPSLLAVPSDEKKDPRCVHDARRHEPNARPTSSENASSECEERWNQAGECEPELNAALGAALAVGLRVAIKSADRECEPDRKERQTERQRACTDGERSLFHVSPIIGNFADLGRELHQPLAHAPLVLRQQPPAQFRETYGWIIKRAQDRLTILNGEAHNSLLGFECDHERLRRVVEAGVMQQSREGEHIFVSYSNAGDVHRGEASP